MKQHECIDSTCEICREYRECQHNIMVERKGDEVHAWQCADCGYIYGRTAPLMMRDFVVEVLVVPPAFMVAMGAAKEYREKRTIRGHSLRDAKRRAGIS